MSHHDSFCLLSYKLALRLPTSFPISGLARLGVKPILQIFLESFCVHSPAHLFFCFLLALFACPLSPRNMLSFTVESILSSSCSRSDHPSLSLAKVRLSFTLTLSHLTIWTDGFVPFSLNNNGSGVLANCSLRGTDTTLSVSAGPVCSSFSAKACAILHALCWSQWHHQVCHISSRPI